MNAPEQKTIVMPPTEKAGDRIGRYKLLQQIGEGGCGVVYMAEQEEPVRRRVALKVIKLGMDTKSVVARFEAERQALALMDHPNIAKVYDAGATETGRPFFIMELVRGTRITDYCDEAKLSTRARLGLFIQVCQAIQHAHQKGIIHRDLKPSNILVTINDDVAVPKVIDFGIAKATTDQRLTDKTLFTAYEQFIGTPAYMSPEQAVMTSLDIDTRSDIYSLGVLLYELLTGKTPFDPKALLEAGFDEMRRTIREKEPERPSTRLSTLVDVEATNLAHRRQIEAPKLIHQLRGDLDWIVMKALEKDRARRFETASALANDIQRYLRNEAIEARPPSAAYRFQKLVRRNKGVFGAVGATSLALVIGLGLSLHLYVEAQHATQRAIAAEKDQARLRKDAEERAELGQKMTAAGLLLSHGDYRKAEELINQLPAVPVSVSFFSVLGSFHGRQGEWAAAASNLTKVVELGPPEHMGYHLLAPLLLQIGDVPGYRRHCQRILSEFGRTTDPAIAERMAKDCLLLPPPSRDLEMIAKMADTALAAGPSHPSWGYFEFVKGFAEFRQGHFEAAAGWLQKLLAVGGPARRNAQAAFVLAMTEQKAGHPAEARSALNKGIETVNAKLPKPGKSDLGDDWNDWIIAHLLLREAKTLIEEGQ